MNAYTALAIAPIALPTWANNAEARDLIAAIIAEQPTRTRHDAMGFQVFQYNGKPARRLRDMFDVAFGAMLMEVHNQHDALVAWRNANNSEVLIARILGDAA